MSDVRKARCRACQSWLAEIEVPSGRIVKLARNVVVKQTRNISDDPRDGGFVVRRNELDEGDLFMLTIPGMTVTLICAKCGRGRSLTTPSIRDDSTT